MVVPEVAYCKELENDDQAPSGVGSWMVPLERPLGNSGVALLGYSDPEELPMRLLFGPLPAPLAPLDDGAANPNNYFNSFYILTWNGAGFNQVYYENDFTVNNVGAGYAGWAVDATPTAPASPPNIPIGTGYFINNIGPVGDWIQYYTNAP